VRLPFLPWSSCVKDPGDSSTPLLLKGILSLYPQPRASHVHKSDLGTDIEQIHKTAQVSFIPKGNIFVLYLPSLFQQMALWLLISVLSFALGHPSHRMWTTLGLPASACLLIHSVLNHLSAQYRWRAWWYLPCWWGWLTLSAISTWLSFKYLLHRSNDCLINKSIR
jgi:hypothetical protein